MAILCNLQRKVGTFGDTETAPDKRLYLKAHWSHLDGKPSTYNPAPHDSTHDAHNDGRYLGKPGEFKLESLSFTDINDGILILCPKGMGAANNVSGSIFIQRSSGAYAISRIDFGYSVGASTDAYGAYLEFVSGTYNNVDNWELVTLTYAGSDWIGLRKTTTATYWFSTAYFLGEQRYTGINRFTWIDTSLATNVATISYGSSKKTSKLPLYASSLYDNNQRVYSPNNKPTPVAIGALPQNGIIDGVVSIRSEDGTWYQKIETADTTDLNVHRFTFHERQGTGSYIELFGVDGNGEIYAKGNKVYHPNNKPSLSDLSGALNMTNNDITFQAADSGDIVWKNGSAVEQARLWLGGSGYLTYRDAITNLIAYRLYHEGYKPTPAAIGALATDDIAAWAKAANKPGYAFNEITGMIDASQLPAIAITDRHITTTLAVFITLEYASLATPVQKGDIIICTEEKKTYIHNGGTAMTSADFNALETPTDVVTSVAGKVGAVSLVKGDVGLGNVPNVDTSNPANITQSASYRFVTDTEKTTWNNKQNALGFTPVPVGRVFAGLDLTQDRTVEAVKTALAYVHTDVGAQQQSAILSALANLGVGVGIVQKNAAAGFTLTDPATLGGTTNNITMNGVSNQNPSFYAPTIAGTDDYILYSNGSGAPSWKGHWGYTPSRTSYSLTPTLYTYGHKALFIYTGTTTRTVTISANSSQAFPIGTEFTFINYNTGGLQLACASGVTINGSSSVPLYSTRYKPLRLIKVDTNAWVLEYSA